MPESAEPTCWNRLWHDPVRAERLTSNVTRPADGAMADPVGTATVAFGLWLQRVVTAPFTPDRIDLVITRGAEGVGRVAARSRRLQTGRVRDYALALALGLAALLFLGLGVAWR